VSSSPSALELRVLLRVATAKDAGVTADVLGRAGIHLHPCADNEELVAQVARGAGVLVLAEEVALGAAHGVLRDALAGQPPWSDLPVIVLARTGANSQAIADVMDEFANVTVIERPMRMAAMVSAIRSALRARRRQYELRTVLEGLREADRRKTEFLATLAHELRNPLAPLTTVLTLLERANPDPAKTGRYYDVMRRQIRHMVRLVDDLLEISRITRNKIELHPAAVPIDEIVGDAVELSRPLLEAAGHRLTVVSAGEAHLVKADRVRLTQVFSNLLNNAAKYTPPGGTIEVTTRCDGNDVAVAVSDTGIGLEPQMLRPIFDMFVQVGGTAKAAQGGLGIGLTLVRNLVELHGGSVEAASRGLHQGATFTVRLPLAAERATAAAQSNDVWPARPLDLSILVVDDNQDAADMLAELLRSAGATVMAAYSGEEALTRSSRQHIDVAVLDIGMPGMDGCDLARRLRANPATEGATLIALTGWGQDADRSRIAAAGFDHHLLKPVDIQKLLSLV
jgi:signal transduction histidine kinase/CheY-like chemotaxis protein